MLPTTTRLCPTRAQQHNHSAVDDHASTTPSFANNHTHSHPLQLSKTPKLRVSHCLSPPPVHSTRHQRSPPSTDCAVCYLPEPCHWPARLAPPHKSLEPRAYIFRTLIENFVRPRQLTFTLPCQTLCRLDICFDLREQPALSSASVTVNTALFHH
jgi:hypothetical protein